jgi:Zn-finger nucleic acid-binding protein
MADRQGVEVDYCRQYRGVGLDRGEPDKIIQRPLQSDGPIREASGDYRSAEYRQPHPRKKKPFLREMFDFD